MRSRNVEAVARRMKLSIDSIIFDNTDVTNFMVPKLIEVRMTSGTFQEGETVTGFVPVSGTNRSITFRLAQQNYKMVHTIFLLRNIRKIHTIQQHTI